MDEGNDVNNQDENIDEQSRSNEMSQYSSSQMKNKVQKKMKDAVMKNAKKNSLLKAIGPLLIKVALILVIIIILIGLIMFLVTMPGMVMEQLKALSKEIGNYISGWFGADTTEQIEDTQIYQTLDYLEQMGYDLKGYGFLTEYLTSDDITQEDKDDWENSGLNGEADEKTGVIRNSDDDKIIKAESDFIFTYLVSDNYVYTLKNSNFVTRDNSSSWLEHLLGGITALYSHYYNIVFGPLIRVLDLPTVQEYWSRGLIALYYEGSDIGEEGAWVSTEQLFNFDTVKINVEKDPPTLEIKKGLFNNAMSYNLDGWTGRYGMPIDFLLSIHLATFMPDLAYDMATSFETIIKIYLHNTEGKAVAAYRNDNDELIKRSDIKKIIEGFWGIENINSEEAMTIMKEFHIESPNNCEKINTEENLSENMENLKCSDSEANNCCAVCLEYIKRIYNNLKDADDKDYATYAPYIASVNQHWYRDVYFVRNNDKNFVKYDYDYEALMKERWTLYETDENGEFKLYEYDENAEGGYGKEFPGTLEDANEKGVKVTKKPVFIPNTDDKYKDLGWQKNSLGHWTAYIEKASATSGGYENAFEDDPENEDNDIRSRIQTNVTTSGNIVQTGEGLRTETNAEIKKMFLYNNYFRYDGSGDTADIIYELRKKVAENHDVDKYYGPLTEDDLKSKVSIENEENQSNEYSVKDYSGTVSLNQDSLNAFSMLENTHTADADYIYRDFKELIVELGYFTKDELTDETPRLLEWLIPDIGSGPSTGTGTSDSDVSGEKIVEVAKKQAKLVKGWTYGAYHRDLNLNNRNEHKTDCSGYVTSVLIEAGFFDEEKIGSREPGAREYWYYGKQKIYGGTGWNYVSEKLQSMQLVDSVSSLPGAEGNVDISKLKPGDILVRAYVSTGGHVGIYIGDEKVLAFPDINQSMFSDCTRTFSESGNWTKAYRVKSMDGTLENGSALSGFPDRTIDKRENEYGTMIHSKGDLDANRKVILAETINKLGSEVSEELEVEQSAEVSEQASGIYTSKSNTMLSNVGAIEDNSETKKASDVSVDEFLEKTREMAEYINAEGYDYCVRQRRWM